MNLSRRISKVPGYDALRGCARPGVLPGVAGGIESSSRARRVQDRLHRPPLTMHIPSSEGNDVGARLSQLVLIRDRTAGTCRDCAGIVRTGRPSPTTIPRSTPSPTISNAFWTIAVGLATINPPRPLARMRFLATTRAPMPLESMNERSARSTTRVEPAIATSASARPSAEARSNSPCSATMCRPGRSRAVRLNSGTTAVPFRRRLQVADCQGIDQLLHATPIGGSPDAAARDRDGEAFDAIGPQVMSIKRNPPATPKHFWATDRFSLTTSRA